MQPTLLSIMGTLAVIIASLVVAIRENSSKTFWSAVIFLGGILGLVATVWSDSRQDAQTAKLLVAQEETIRLGKELATYTSGADSFCYYEPTVSTSRNAAIGALVNFGTNPLYDVRARIIPDPHKRLFLKRDLADYEVLKEMMTLERWIDIGTLNSSNKRDVGIPAQLIDLDLGKTETRRAYNVFFSARNDRFIQLLRFMRTPNGWRVAYRVMKDTGEGLVGTVLKESVQSEYPLNAGGQVDWQWPQEE